VLPKRTVSVTILSLVIFTIFAASAVWLLRDYHRYKNDTENIRQTIVRYEREVVQREMQYAHESGKLSPKQTRSKMLQTIAGIRYGDEGYVFVVSYEGVILTSVMKQDPSENVVSTILEAAQANPQGTFVDYPKNQLCNSYTGMRMENRGWALQ